jgi:hypothetical protein
MGFIFQFCFSYSQPACQKYFSVPDSSLKPFTSLHYKNFRIPEFREGNNKKFPMGWESHDILGLIFWEWPHVKSETAKIR